MAVITISRQFGAGGITLGELVSKKLGYRFFDNEIIQMVAKKAKVSTNWVESMEKEAGGKIQRLISGMVSKRLVDRILDMDHGYIDEEINVDLLHEIIGKIAAEGNAVILFSPCIWISDHFRPNRVKLVNELLHPLLRHNRFSLYRSLH